MASGWPNRGQVENARECLKIGDMIARGWDELKMYERALDSEDRGEIDFAFEGYKIAERDFYCETGSFFPIELEATYVKLTERDIDMRRDGA